MPDHGRYFGAAPVVGGVSRQDPERPNREPHQLNERGANLESATRDVAQAVARVGGSAPFTLDLAATVITATRHVR